MLLIFIAVTGSVAVAVGNTLPHWQVHPHQAYDPSRSSLTMPDSTTSEESVARHFTASPSPARIGEMIWDVVRAGYGQDSEAFWIYDMRVDGQLDGTAVIAEHGGYTWKSLRVILEMIDNDKYAWYMNEGNEKELLEIIELCIHHNHLSWSQYNRLPFTQLHHA